VKAERVANRRRWRAALNAHAHAHASRARGAANALPIKT
jgi:hypothetical protein